MSNNVNLITSVISYLVDAGILWVIGLFVENEYHIINRIRKWWAIKSNKETDARISLEYKTTKDFKEVKEDFKRIFRKDKDFRISKDISSRMDFVYDLFSVKLILNQEGNIFINTDRIGCGIKELKNKIGDILEKIRELEKDETIKEFISGDISFTLPYKWDNLNIWKPKGLKIKKYNVSFSENNYKSEIDISLNKINIKIDTKEAISHIIDKFI